MIKKEIILSHNGDLNFETIGILLSKLKKEMDSRGISVTLYKKVLTVMIESLENIYKYDDLINENYFPKFTIERQDNQFILTAGNPVDKKSIKMLKEKIDCVNKLDKQELRKLYRKTITDGRFSKKGGAGLGFIEMAKISGNKIQYRFEDINKNTSYYILEVKISN